MVQLELLTQRKGLKRKEKMSVLNLSKQEGGNSMITRGINYPARTTKKTAGAGTVIVRRKMTRVFGPGIVCKGGKDC